MPRDILSIKQKALSMNLDDRKYGSFAEIGAGQEVVRHFFQAGGAAGTVAKSTSAYDMVFSDSLYGKSNNERYVSEGRLLSMLKHEFDMVLNHLDGVRHEDSTFFSFANTVAAKSYKRDSDCHGWLGIRFQARPKDKPTDIVLHIHMLDNNSLMQQEVIGAIGVNLIYAAFHYLGDQNTFVESLVDNVAPGRVEIDMIDFFGENITHINDRLANIHLVKKGLTKAIIFNEEGRVRQPAEILYKRPLLIQRGNFRPITHVNINMQHCALTNFLKEPDVHGHKPLLLMEITFNNIMDTDESMEKDYLHRIELLTSMGHNVLISNFARHHQFAHYISKQSKQIFALVIGASNLRETLNEEYYQDLDGGILEAFGKLFSKNGKLYIYPKYDEKRKELITAANLPVPPRLKHLYQHLLENHHIRDLNGCDISKLHIYSRDVYQMMQEGSSDWVKFVPDQVVEVIKQKNLWSNPNSSS